MRAAPPGCASRSITSAPAAARAAERPAGPAPTMASRTVRNSPWEGGRARSGNSPSPASLRATSSATRPSTREETSR